MSSEDDALREQVSKLTKEKRESNLRWEKEKALLEQKNEFCQLEIKELQNKLKQSEEYSLLLVQFTDEGKSNSDKNLKANKNADYEEMERNYKKQLSSKDKIIEQLKDHHQGIVDDLESKAQELLQRQVKDEVNILNQEEKLKVIEELNDQVKLRDLQLQQIKEQGICEKNKACQELEEEIENIKNKHQSELNKAEFKFEELVSQIKNVQSQQVKHLESASETERRRIKEREDEWKKVEEEFRDQILMKESFLSRLKDEYQFQEKAYQSKIKQLEDKIKRVEIINEDKLNDFKECWKQKEQLLVRQVKEREDQIMEWKIKVDEIQKIVEILEKREKQVVIETAVVKENEKSTREEWEREKEQIQKDKKSWINEKAALDSSIAQMNNNNIVLRTQLEEIKIISEEKERLYYDQLLDERTKTRKMKEKYEETIQNSERQFQKKEQEMKEKSQKEKEDMTKNMNKMEKCTRDIENTYSGQMVALERELNIQKEEINKKQNKIESLQKLIENQQYQEQILSEKAHQSTLNISQLIDKIEKYKNLSKHYSEKLQESEQSATTQKILANQKVQFLESQKERAKKDLSEAQSKFQQVLVKMQAIRKSDKQEQQENTRALIDALERRYEQKINDIKSEHSGQISFMEQQMRVSQIRSDIRFKDKESNYSQSSSLLVVGDETGGGQMDYLKNNYFNNDINRNNENKSNNLSNFNQNNNITDSHYQINQENLLNMSQTSSNSQESHSNNNRNSSQIQLEDCSSKTSPQINIFNNLYPWDVNMNIGCEKISINMLTQEKDKQNINAQRPFNEYNFNIPVLSYHSGQQQHQKVTYLNQVDKNSNQFSNDNSENNPIRSINEQYSFTQDPTMNNDMKLNTFYTPNSYSSQHVQNIVNEILFRKNLPSSNSPLKQNEQKKKENINLLI